MKILIVFYTQVRSESIAISVKFFRFQRKYMFYSQIFGKNRHFCGKLIAATDSFVYMHMLSVLFQCPIH